MTLTLDPYLFTDAAISDQTRAFNARLEAMLAELPATHEVPPEITRAARDEGKGIRVRISPAPSGAPRALYLHIHGGGWTLGRPSYDDARNQALAASADVTVISIEYRLAPEHCWPAQREDCLAALQWVLGPARDIFGTERIILGGESAGAHLAMTTALALRNMQRSAIAGLVLNYGVFDLTLTPSAANWGERKLILNSPSIAWFVDNLDPGGHQRAGDGLSPLKAPLHDLPPALFQIGTADPLIDDTVMMATRYATAGNDTEVAVYPGGVHAFDAFQELDIARAARARLATFVRARSA
jgi:acetyl esterase/lipase